MASFQAKMGMERPRKREKKNYRSDHFLPEQEQKIKKKQKKIQKIQKHRYSLFSCQNGSGAAEKERKKKLSFQSIPTQPGIENYKKIAKQFKKLKKINMASFHDKTGWERSRKREKKNYRSDQFLPDL